MKKLFLILVVCMATFHISNAQFRSVLAEPDSLPRFEFRFLRASFYDVHKEGILSGVYDLSFSYPFNNSWAIEISLPVAFMKYEVPMYDYGYGYGGYYYRGIGYGGYQYLETPDTKEKNDNGVGNLMIGIRSQKWLNKSRCFQWRGQLYLPTTSKDEFDLGMFMLATNFMDFPKYAQEATTATFQLGYYNNPERGGFYYADGGPQFVWSHDADIDSEIYFRYALGGGYNCGFGAISGEYIGQAMLTEDIDDIMDRFRSALNFGVHYTKSKVKPSLFYSMYLDDDLKEMVSGILGVKVAIHIESIH